MSNAAKKFSSKNILATILSVLYYYFNSPTKLFSDLYLAKILDTSAIVLFVYLVVLA